MQAQNKQAQSNQMLERRTDSPEQSLWWSKLSLAQKFSASSLGKFGYELLFIRHDNGKSIAVLNCSNGIAVISDDGDIDTKPNIHIRH